MLPALVFMIPASSTQAVGKQLDQFADPLRAAGSPGGLPHL